MYRYTQNLGLPRRNFSTSFCTEKYFTFHIKESTSIFGKNFLLSILTTFHVTLCLQLESGRAAVLVAKVLYHCVSVLKEEEEVKGLWTRCGLTWDDLGTPKEDVEEFLDRQVKKSNQYDFTHIFNILF